MERMDRWHQFARLRISYSNCRDSWDKEGGGFVPSQGVTSAPRPHQPFDCYMNLAKLPLPRGMTVSYGVTVGVL
jgi:hypothetical protein